MSLAADETGASPVALNDTGGIGGHPRGLTTLFYTEMWERFSFYGMKALLVLYMTKSVAEGGLNFSESYSGLIAATYFSSVYWTPLIGGWLADKVFGARRAVLIGGIVIASGHFSMVFHTMPNFYAGLILIAAGTGMLKPNVSAMVGDLYTEEDKRRDAGFSIFYMGINLGAFIAPLICGNLGEKVDWHYGFAAAGIGMVLGIIQYLLPFTVKVNLRLIVATVAFVVGGLLERLFWNAVYCTPGPILYMIGAAIAAFILGLIATHLFLKYRKRPTHTTTDAPNGKWIYLIHGYPLKAVGVPPSKRREIVKPDIKETRDIAGETGGVDVVTIALAVVVGIIGFALGYVYGGAGVLSGLFPGVAGFFAGYLAGVVRHLSGDELKRVLVIFILFVFSALFWMSFEQASTTLTLFADRLTDRTFMCLEIKASLFQSIEPFFLIIFAPAFAWLWIRLGRREPSSPAKFAYGLFFAGVSFAVVAFASTLTGAGKVSPLWLVLVYLLQTIGELCLSPVGLSTVTKLSPARMVGLMMGVWFLSISIGDYFAGLVLGLFNDKAEGALLRLFGIVALVTFAAAIVLALLTPLIKKMTPRAT
ncbi:MAG: MFS transporter [Acidobacteria bacterium]|nr:MAG: MFS transporter [Acidobacteriota bacterium]